MRISKLTWIGIISTALSFQAAAQPRLTAVTWVTEGTMRIYSVSAHVATGINFRLQASTSLASNSWIEVGGAVATSAQTTLNVTNSIATEPPYQFFRLIAQTSTVVPVNMVLISAGSFEMGNTFSDWPSYAARPVHSVNVSAFYMDKTEVTKALWDEVKVWGAGKGYAFDNPGSGKAANHPVHLVNWFDAVKWCNARSEKEGRVPSYYMDPGFGQVYTTGQMVPYVKWNGGYRLPTEAEWEKAARGGAAGHRFPWTDVDTITHSRANYRSYWENGHPFYAYDANPTEGYHQTYSIGGEPYASPVGSFAANGYGLYDMAGNVWEWCWDFYGSYSSVSQNDPRGPLSGEYQVIRGGGWESSALLCTAAGRGAGTSQHRDINLGFRSVLPSGQ